MRCAPTSARWTTSPTPAATLPAGVAPERFEVVVDLLSLSQHRRLRVRVQIPESDPGVPTVFDLWPGAEAMEREAYDMIGIRFLTPSRPDPDPHA